MKHKYRVSTLIINRIITKMKAKEAVDVVKNLMKNYYKNANNQHTCFCACAVYPLLRSPFAAVTIAILIRLLCARFTIDNENTYRCSFVIVCPNSFAFIIFYCILQSIL